MSTPLPKLVPMSGLQEQVYDLGVCPKCHTKTLEDKHVAGDFRAVQCTGCGMAFLGQVRRLDG
jgi:hypothetical protein